MISDLSGYKGNRNSMKQNPGVQGPPHPLPIPREHKIELKGICLKSLLKVDLRRDVSSL